MNVQVLINGNDVTDSVVSYARDKGICSGIGSLEVVIKRNTSIVPIPFNEVELYEEGVAKGTYYIHTIDTSLPDNTIRLSCQDASLKLQEYWETETYFIDYPSTSDYWIKLFMDHATVAYQFSGVSVGTLIANDTTLGMSTALDLITPLLQQNGWYLTFTHDNTAKIGKLAVTGNYVAVLNDDQILEISTNLNDKMFRNRVVVWGNTNPKTGQWVFSNIDRTGQYENEYGPNDTRTVVISSPRISSGADATALGYQALKEFDQKTQEVTVTLAGVYSFDVGDQVFVNSRYFAIGGIITSIASELSSSGLTTTIILNQRCPRLFAFYDWGGYVYVGTKGSGVWRKPLQYTHTWENFSAGLTDLNINHLAIDNGVFACTSLEGNLFIRNATDTAWQKFPTPKSGMFTTCTIDKTTNEIIAPMSMRTGVSNKFSDSWIYYIRSLGQYSNYHLIDKQGGSGYKVTGIGNNGTSNLVAAVQNFQGDIVLVNDSVDGTGFQTAYIQSGITDGSFVFNNAFISGIAPSGVMVSGVLTSGLGLTVISATDGVIMPFDQTENFVGDGNYIYTVFADNFFTGGGYVSSVKVSEINTRFPLASGSPIASYSYSPDTEVRWTQLYPSYVMAAGNRSIVMPYLDKDYYLNFWTHDFISNKDTHTKSYVTNNGDGDIVGVGFIVTDQQRKLLTIISDNTFNYLVLFDPDVKATTLLTSFTGPTPSFGGNFLGISQLDRTAASRVGDYLIYKAYASYDGISYQGRNISISVPVVISVNVYSYTAVVNAQVAENLYSWGGMEALYNLDGVISRGGKDGFYFELFTEITVDTITDYYELIVKATKDSCQIIRSGKTSEQKAHGGVLTNEFADYLINYDNQNIEIVDVGTRQPVKTLFNKRFQDVAFFSRMDSISGATYGYYYDALQGSIERFPIGSGVAASLPLSIFPHTTDYADWKNFTFQQRYTNAYHWYDIFGISLFSMSNYANGTWAWWENSKIICPSGNRLLKTDYTVWVHDDAKLLKGYKNQAYEMVFDIDYPSDVEVDQSYPEMVFGGITYSGLLVSGIQTGYQQSKFYVTPFGDKGSYTDVITHGMQGYVPDVRSFTTMAGSGEDITQEEYVIFPQFTTPVYGPDSTTDITVVPVDKLNSYGGVLIASGSLSSGVVLVSFPGYANHVETTNTQEYPYLFVSISGTPPQFFQKDSHAVGEDAQEFIDRTNNLPNSEILVIRCDDSI